MELIRAKDVGLSFTSFDHILRVLLESHSEFERLASRVQYASSLKDEIECDMLINTRSTRLQMTISNQVFRQS